ncbi:class I SAM-dependent methyltransferase [Nocardioides sp. Soil805]|uniref:class I SAM-dependent methyltransferase n=1 Tax=Nocardioides sp. Soil805 TaxID=1736416 RepID=UPI0007033EF1|nr:class I SAM-dependent methyltransferase [Nocardioides sp. Soil805]KRF36806.1 SAM-dependent methyltransferase [Nocardioides sp. Soil805]
MSTSTDTPDEISTDAAAERVFGAVLGAVDLLSIYLGDRLGYYRSLADEGPATAVDLAARTGTDPRYTREWLEQQAVTSLLAVDQAPDPVFRLPDGMREVLTDASSLSYLAPVARLMGAVGPVLPDLLDAYHRGSGVSWDDLGDDARMGQADANRPWYERRLAEALASVPDLHDRLSAPGARFLDVGCGAGWSTISLARAYPGATFTGIDIDAPSVAMAQDNARAAGVDDRTTFTHADAGALEGDGYEAAFAFECVHDMPRPVEVLSAVHRALAPGAPLVVMDEAVADAFAPDGDELERMMYGFSLFVCLPDGLSSPPSVGTGTVMRPSTLAQYGRDAGFSSCETLPIEDFGFWRFYLLQ